MKWTALFLLAFPLPSHGIEGHEAVTAAAVTASTFPAGAWGFASVSTVTIASNGNQCLRVNSAGDTLLVDCQNNRVGIGVAVPGATLTLLAGATIAANTGTISISTAPKFTAPSIFLDNSAGPAPRVGIGTASVGEAALKLYGMSGAGVGMQIVGDNGSIAYLPLVLISTGPTDGINVVFATNTITSANQATWTSTNPNAVAMTYDPSGSVQTFNIGFLKDSNPLWLKSNQTVGISTNVPNASLAIVPKASETYALLVSSQDSGTAGLTVRSDNQRVGIGTLAPVSTFTVAGIIASTSSSAGFPSYTFIGDLDTGLYSPAQNVFAVTTGGTERLRINGSGQVGIGTTTPGQVLEVDGGNFQFDKGNTGGVLLFGTSGVTGIQGTGGGLANLQLAGNTSLIFNAGGGTRATITSGGLGIGTATPATALDVVGTAQVSGASTFASSMTVNQIAEIKDTSAADQAAVLYVTHALNSFGVSNYREGLSVGEGPANGSMNVYIWVDGTNNVGFIQAATKADNWRALVINPNGSGGTIGSVAIGNDTTPDGKLEVVSDGAGETYVLLVSSANGSTNLFNVGTNGNVGVANATPATTLDITGTFQTSGASTFGSSETVKGTLEAVSQGAGASYSLYISSNNRTTVDFGVQANGHIDAEGGGGTPALTSCGTGPTITGNDVRGTFAVGPTGTGCTLTFKNAYATAPICMVDAATSGLTSPGYTISGTAITLTSLTASDTYYYLCLGK